jgi:hypothetical protein
VAAAAAAATAVAAAAVVAVIVAGTSWRGGLKAGKVLDKQQQEDQQGVMEVQHFSQAGHSQCTAPAAATTISSRWGKGSGVNLKDRSRAPLLHTAKAAG